MPKEFREDVIRVYRDSDASMAQVAKDFGISPSCLKRWLAEILSPNCRAAAQVLSTISRYPFFPYARRVNHAGRARHRLELSGV